jgi:hypothetical protein
MELDGCYKGSVLHSLICLNYGSVHMSLIDHLISQPSLDISPMWTPVITSEVK